MHSRLRSKNLYLVTELRFQSFGKRFAALRVEPPCFADVPREMPSLEKIRKRGLIKRRREKVVRSAYRLETVDQRMRNYDVTQAKRGEKCLTERADINDTRARIQTLQRCDRHAFISIFAVIVVFDDPGVMTMRPFE